MRTIATAFASCLVAAITAYACSGAIAPTSSGTNAAATDGGTSESTTASSTGKSTTSKGTTTASDATTGAGTTAAGTTAGSTTGSGSGSASGSGSVTTVTTVGSATAEDGDLGLKTHVKNVYGYVTDAGGSKTLTIFATEGDFSTDTFRKIKTYDTCRDYPKATNSTTKSMSISFLHDAVTPANSPIDDNGFPKNDDYEKTSSAAYTVSVAYSEGTDTTKSLFGGLMTGKILTFTTKPSAVVAKYSDPAATAAAHFEVKVDSGFFPLTAQDYSSPTKTYKVTLEGDIYSIPTQPTAPTCPSGQYAPAKTYEAN